MPKGVSATYTGAARSAAARKGAASRQRARNARAAAAIQSGIARGTIAPAEPYVAPTPGALKAVIDRALARVAAAKAREHDA